MATPQTLLIPFAGGLDTYSNAQLLKPGYLTSSLGTMLDRPGTAYPGPGFSPTQWAPTATRTNHGIGSYSSGPATSRDQLLLWSTLSGGTGPGVSTPGTSAAAATVQPLAPWRQVVQKFQNDSVIQVGGTAAGTMAGPPQSAVVGDRAFYVWRGTGGSTNYLAMCYQDLSTRAWAGPYYQNASGDWVTDPSAASVNSITGQMAIAGDRTYLRVATLPLGGGSLTMSTYTAASPLTRTAFTTDTSATFTMVDIVGMGDEAAISGTLYGAVAAYDDTSQNLVGYSFSQAASSFGAQVILTGMSGGAGQEVAISASRIFNTTALSTGFLFVAMINTDDPVVVTTGLTLGTVVATTITGVTSADLVRQISVVNTTAGSAATVALAIEYRDTESVFGVTQSFGYVYFATVTLASPGSLSATSTVYGWGGMALMGKLYGWYNGAEYRPLCVLRSGWWHNVGTWGTASTAGTATFAYPNGYLYGHTGTLYGRFGDADVGTNTLWAPFSSSNYKPTQLQPVANLYRYNLSTSQQTLNCSWPQYGYADFISARAGDVGSPIGAKAGLSTVTWLAPTASEPPAPMAQFDRTLVIPGSITAYFDGSNVFEAGFFHRSPTPFLQSNGSGGSLPDATVFYYQTVMIYQDAAGRLHQAAPSRLVAGTTTANNDRFNIRVPMYRQTLRNQTTPVQILVYRSVGNPGSFATSASFSMYQVTTINILNDTYSSAYICAQVTDGTTDAILANGNRIYTQEFAQGAASGTDAPPPFDSLAIWNGQLWGVANRNGPELWCSWPADTAQLNPEGPAWSGANRVAIPADVGQPKALEGMDEKLLLLGTRADYGLLAGALPRSVSLADDPSLASAPIALPTPGGIRVLNGTTTLPDGILIQGTQGFTMLGRDLKYKRVGLPVNDLASANLYLPGVFLPEQQAVLLFSASATTGNLAYFYEQDEWAQVEQPPASDVSTSASAVVVGATRAVAGQASQVYVLPSTAGFYCTVAPYSKYAKYRTPWVELKDLQGGPHAAGYGYLREVQLLGTLPAGANTQTVTLYTEYDYESNAVQTPDTQTLSLSTALDYQWRFGFSQGNARRVRFTVTIDGGQRTSNGSSAATVLLTGLELSYDVDNGLSRLGASNSIGS